MTLVLWNRQRRKDAGGNVTLEELVRRLDGSKNTLAGEQITPELALKAPTVYSIVNLVRRTVAQLPIDIIANTGDKREPQKEHPLVRVLNQRPNQWQTPFQFKASLATRTILYGNYFGQKQRTTAGKVINIVPLPPPAVRVEQLDSLYLAYHVTTLKGGTKTLSQDQVMHVRDFSSDDVTGEPLVVRLRESIGLEIAAERYGAEFFGNSAIPSGVIEHPGSFMDDESRTRFADSWRALFARKGKQRQGTAVLEGGIKYNAIAVNNKESQFLEVRKAQREIIAGAFGIPPHMIGSLDRATFNNIEHMSLEYVIFFLTSLLVNIEQQMERDLLPESEQGSLQIKFNVGGLLRGDQKSRAETLQIQRQNGVINANEWRRIEDMNPIEGPEGAVYLAPINLGKPGEKPKEAEPPAPAGREDPEEDAEAA